MAFQKGQSGNPNGRSKKDTVVVSMARKHAIKAIETLAQIMDDTRVPSKTRVSAACALLDRGYGRPAQIIDATITDDRDVRDLSTAELARRAAEIANRVEELAARVGGSGEGEDEHPDVRQLN